MGERRKNLQSLKALLKNGGEVVSIRYLPLEEAKKELERRLGNQELQQKLEETFSEIPYPPPIPKGAALLARHLATARLEDVLFFQRAKEIGLTPVWGTYREDWYFSGNPSKKRLLELRIFYGYGKRGGVREAVIKIANSNNHTRINQIKTVWGEGLEDFHLRTRRLVGIDEQVIDLSAWLKSIGRAKDYYYYYLLLAVGRCVLFESFESPGFRELEKFKREVVLPAIQEIRNNDFPYPLIVYHPQVSSLLEEEIILNYYPPEILRAIPPEYLP